MKSPRKRFRVTYQPVAELVVRPSAIDGLSRAIMVALELLNKFIAILLVVGLDDAAVDEPLVLKIAIAQFCVRPKYHWDLPYTKCSTRYRLDL